jgi:hypothetical protein
MIGCENKTQYQLYAICEPRLSQKVESVFGGQPSNSQISYFAAHKTVIPEISSLAPLVSAGKHEKSLKNCIFKNN